MYLFTYLFLRNYTLKFNRDTIAIIVKKKKKAISGRLTDLCILFLPDEGAELILIVTFSWSATSNVAYNVPMTQTLLHTS